MPNYTHWMWLFVCCVLCCLLCVGCTNETPCKKDSECTTGWICVANICRVPSGCSDNSFCDPLFSCDVDGLCKRGCWSIQKKTDAQGKEEYIRVSEDTRCAAGDACFELKCKPIICGSRAKPPTPQTNVPCYSGDQRHVATSILQSGGQCRKGVKDCIHNGTAWGTCYTEVLDSPEICDGVDNDCDGKIDNTSKDCACVIGDTRPCQTLPKKTVLRSATVFAQCKGGVQHCVPGKKDKRVGQWAACLGEIKPVYDKVELARCFIRDRNCNGQLDPGVCTCTKEQENQKRSCFPHPLKKVAPAACTAQKGTPFCMQYILGANGRPTKTCAEKQWGCLLGRCKQGFQTCIKSCKIQSKTLEQCAPDELFYVWSGCDSAILPIPEDYIYTGGEHRSGQGGCNNIDDDCDGKIDNRSDDPQKPLRQLCYPDNTSGCTLDSATRQMRCTGICKPGFRTCNSSRKEWSLCVGAIRPQTESRASKNCTDGKDNDCDGKVDQEDPDCR